MTDQYVSPIEAVPETPPQSSMDSYHLGLRQQSELVNIYKGSLEFATISCLAPQERIAVLGELSVQYADRLPEHHLRTHADSDIRMWHDYLRGRSVVDISQEWQVGAGHVRNRFTTLRESMRTLCDPLVELVEKVGGVQVGVEHIDDFNAIAREPYVPPANSETPADYEYACVGLDPESFFPEYKDERQARVAKKVCTACMMHNSCREQGIEEGQEYGIWGGLTEDERQKMRRHTSESILA